MEKLDNAMFTTLIHHILGFLGAYLGIYIGGHAGSISHVTAVTELSAPFLNARVFIQTHGYGEKPIYLVNGFMIMFSFFILRIVFMSWLVWGEFFAKAWLQRDTYWPAIEEHKRATAVVGILLYPCLYVLNIYWFKKIVMGLLKAAGLVKSSKKVEKKD